MASDKISWASLLNMKSCHVNRNENFFFFFSQRRSRECEASWNIIRLMNVIPIVFRLSPICFLMTLFSSICFSFQTFSDQSLWLVFVWGQRISAERVLCFRKSSSTHERQLVIFNYFSTSSNIMFWNYAKRCFSRQSIRLAEVSKRIKCFSCSCDETQGWRISAQGTWSAYLTRMSLISCLRVSIKRFYRGWSRFQSKPEKFASICINFSSKSNLFALQKSDHSMCASKHKSELFGLQAKHKNLFPHFIFQAHSLNLRGDVSQDKKWLHFDFGFVRNGQEASDSLNPLATSSDHVSL